MCIVRNFPHSTSFPLDLFRSFGCSSRLFFSFLFGSAFVEVLHHDTDEHVQDEESHQEQKRNEIDQIRFIVILHGLHIHVHRIDAVVHDLNPTVARRENEQREQCLTDRQTERIDWSRRALKDLPGRGYRSCTVDFSSDVRARRHIVVAWWYCEHRDRHSSRTFLWTTVNRWRRQMGDLHGEQDEPERREYRR